MLYLNNSARRTPYRAMNRGATVLIEQDSVSMEQLADLIEKRASTCRLRYGPLYDILLEQARTGLLMEMQRKDGMNLLSAALGMGLRGELAEYVGDEHDALHFRLCGLDSPGQHTMTPSRSTLAIL